MTKKTKLSKDPKVKLLTLKEILTICDYFKGGIPKQCRWLDKTVPCEDSSYFKITGDKIIVINYGCTFKNYGMELAELLDSILVAYRDGKTEYDLFDTEIERLKKERLKRKKSKRLDDEILETEKAKKRLPKFQKKENEPKPKRFEEYLIDTGRKTDASNFNQRYLVFDVETNGTRRSNDDLLSLSIYDPSTGICYNRYFPLELQPVILTGFIHGITDDTLKGATHMTQEEMNQIIEYFDLKNSVLLSYSGGKGEFDSAVVINYCKRRGVTGFENLKFENIKQRIPPAPYEASGQLTKDNLCRMLGIAGVTDVHSGMNDCLLEWELFEKLVKEPVFFIQNNLYKYSEDYIIPASYIPKHRELLRLAKIKLPPVLGYPETVFECGFPKKALRFIKKFPTNITGITIENAINSILKVKRQDNLRFLADNKRHLEFVGSLDSNLEEIPIITENDGTIKTTDPQYENYVSEINDVTKTIMECLGPTIDFIKKNIFPMDDVLSQELVISEDKKILALCDLSSKTNILEIKTMDFLEEDEYGVHISPKVSLQLYYQRRGRGVYALSMMFERHWKKGSFEEVLDGLKIKIYKVDLRMVEVKPRVYKPGLYATQILKTLNEDGSLCYRQISEKTGLSERMIQNVIQELKREGYLVRKGPAKRNGWWKVLKNENGEPLTEP